MRRRRSGSRLFSCRATPKPEGAGVDGVESLRLPQERRRVKLAHVVEGPTKWLWDLDVVGFECGGGFRRHPALRSAGRRSLSRAAEHDVSLGRIRTDLTALRQASTAASNWPCSLRTLARLCQPAGEFGIQRQRLDAGRRRLLRTASGRRGRCPNCCEGNGIGARISARRCRRRSLRRIFRPPAARYRAYSVLRRSPAGVPPPAEKRRSPRPPPGRLQSRTEVVVHFGEIGVDRKQALIHGDGAIKLVVFGAR